MAGKTAGVIGLGGIGSLVAAKLGALGMRVLAYDPYVKAERALEMGAKLVKLDELLKESDVLTIHVPHTDETENLIDAGRLALVKPGCYFINTSSPAVVSEAALVEALRSNRIARAALDVFSGHPISPSSQFLSLSNVVLTPHIGGATHETIKRYSQMLTDDIFRFLDGEKPRNLANPEVWKYVR
jgi:D-3-phosphoglycerate dehydrogenase